jgi:hypothetical protein
MKMLTRTAFEQARQHLFQQGRSLDQVRYRFQFESGPAGAVLDELARYQNRSAACFTWRRPKACPSGLASS